MGLLPLPKLDGAGRNPDGDQGQDQRRGQDGPGPTLKQNFSGLVIPPDDVQYDRARNSVLSKGNPALIVRPKSEEDLVKTIQFARDNGLTVSIRSGGHSVAGFSTNSGGMVIDMVLMNNFLFLFW